VITLRVPLPRERQEGCGTTTPAPPRPVVPDSGLPIDHPLNLQLFSRHGAAPDHAGGSHSSMRLPSGSVTQPKRLCSELCKPRERLFLAVIVDLFSRFTASDSNEVALSVAA